MVTCFMTFNVCDHKAYAVRAISARFGNINDYDATVI